MGRDYGIDLCGSACGNVQWQAHTEEAFDPSCFTIDWDNEKATCPAGKNASAALHDCCGNEFSENGALVSGESPYKYQSYIVLKTESTGGSRLSFGLFASSIKS